MNIRTRRKFLALALFAVFGFIPLARAQTGPINLNSANQCATISAANQATVGIVVSGTWSATLQPEVSVQGQAASNTTVTPAGSTTGQSTITTNGTYSAQVAGMSTFLVCVSAYTSGTVTIYMQASQAVNAGLFGGSGGSGLPAGCSGTSGQITCSIFATSNNNGGITGTEGTGAALTAGTGVDLLWPDSTAHRWKANLNNGGAVNVPTVAAAGTNGHFVVYAANGIDLVDGGTGGVAVGASLFSVLMQHPKRWAYAVAGSTSTIANFGSGAGSALQAGTASFISGGSGNGPFIQWASGAVSGNQAGWAYNALTDWWSGNNLYWGARVWNKNTDLTNQRMWIGLTDVLDANLTTDFNTDTLGTVQHIAMFRFSSVAGDTNWMCVTGNASAQTVTSSGVAADVAAPHTFEIRENDGVNVQFWIDGALVATNTTNLPMTGGPFRQAAVAQITTQTTAAKNLALTWQSIQSDN